VADSGLYSAEVASEAEFMPGDFTRHDQPGPRLKFCIDGESWPQLVDHQIRGVMVLPLAVALELFGRAVRNDQPMWRLRRLHVLRGVRLSELGPTEVWVVSRPDGRLELLDGEGLVRVAARVEHGPPAALLPDDELPEDAPSACYGPRALFHGPMFRVIRSIGLSERRARAVLAGTLAQGWPGGPWATDPAALDGALQVAALWAQHQTSLQYLPLRVDELIVSRSGPRGELLRCVVVGRDANAMRALADVDVVAGDEPVASLRGVEMYGVPGGTAARETGDNER
jgi:hypothetical protein